MLLEKVKDEGDVNELRELSRVGGDRSPYT